MNKPDFSKSKVGDRAAFLHGPYIKPGETNCTIVDTNSELNYPIRIDIDYGGWTTFTTSGFLCKQDKLPLLYHTMPEIIGGCDPPKRKKKIIMQGFANIYPESGKDMFSIYGLYKSIEKAVQNSDKSCLGQIYIDQEIEIDE